MNNILKIFISLLFFLLLITTAGQEEYASVKSSFFQKSNVTSSYQQTQSPCTVSYTHLTLPTILLV